MDVIVLGLLMIHNCTIYEMRKTVKTYMSNISSNSLGSIQAAIRKLTEKGMIDFTEHVENSVNKKVYTITPTGKKYFMTAISSPMLYKEKNMELSKFFFMGFADRCEWEGLLDSYIVELQKELDALEKINQLISPRMQINRTSLNTMKEEGLSHEITEDRAKNIALFQYATLDLGMKQLKFQIRWFEDFKQTLSDRSE